MVGRLELLVLAVVNLLCAETIMTTAAHIQSAGTSTNAWNAANHTHMCTPQESEHKVVH